MNLSIDFHQFTYPQLIDYFKEVGFSSVLDLVDFKMWNTSRLGRH